MARPANCIAVNLHGTVLNVRLLYRNVQWFQGGLVFKAHRLLYHSTLGKKKSTVADREASDLHRGEPPDDALR